MTREERELSIEYLEGIKDDYVEGYGYERHPLPEYYAIESAIKALKQEPKVGHWIELENWFDIGKRVQCSECGQIFVTGDHISRHYCCNCGMKMEEENL